MKQQSHFYGECNSLPVHISSSQPCGKSKQRDKPVRGQSYRNSIYKCSGFTLLEMATTLMIMSLLIGSVVKAQGIMDTNTSHMLEEDFRHIPLYINEYQDKFKTLPGDDPTIGSAGSHLGAAISCAAIKTGYCMPGSGIIDGRWNDTTAASESFLVWQQLRLAGLVTGDTDTSSASYFAKNIVGGAIGVTNQANTPIVGLKGSYIVCSDGIAGKYVKQIEIALDDGNANSGSVMVTIHGTAIGGTAITTNSIINDELYLVCMGV